MRPRFFSTRRKFTTRAPRLSSIARLRRMSADWGNEFKVPPSREDEERDANGSRAGSLPHRTGTRQLPDSRIPKVEFAAKRIKSNVPATCQARCAARAA